MKKICHCFVQMFVFLYILTVLVTSLEISYKHSYSSRLGHSFLFSVIIPHFQFGATLIYFVLFQPFYWNELMNKQPTVLVNEIALFND